MIRAFAALRSRRMTMRERDNDGWNFEIGTDSYTKRIRRESFWGGFGFACALAFLISLLGRCTG